jgi:hypothetical protein
VSFSAPFISSSRFKPSTRILAESIWLVTDLSVILTICHRSGSLQVFVFALSCSSDGVNTQAMTSRVSTRRYWSNLSRTMRWNWGWRFQKDATVVRRC